MAARRRVDAVGWLLAGLPELKRGVSVGWAESMPHRGPTAHEKREPGRLPFADGSTLALLESRPAAESLGNPVKLIEAAVLDDDFA